MSAILRTRPPLPAVRPLRVLIVDDSAVVRNLLARWIAAEPGLEVVGTAENGQAALEGADRLRPDVVLLDLEMPVMSGTEALRPLLAGRPGLFVIVVSTLTTRGAAVALRCLADGAFDYLTKPETQGAGTGTEAFRRDLIGKLHGLDEERRRRAAPPLPPRTAPKPAGPGSADPRPADRKPADVKLAGPRPATILLGASTGGPQATIRVLSGLRGAAPLPPILVVQHMPPIVTGVFAEHIRTETGLDAREATDGEPITGDRVYVAPGGRHLRVSGTPGRPVVRLDDGDPVQFCRPAVDHLFTDAAALFGPAVLAVVLTGMGQDGTAGARCVKGAGGTVIVQDEGTSTVWGMPGSVAKSGLADHVLPLGAVAGAVGHLLRRPRT